MDRSVQDEDREPGFHLSSSSSSPALAYLAMHTDHTPITSKQQSQGFDFSAQDVLSGFNVHTSSQPRRHSSSVDHISSRRNRSSGSLVHFTGELSSPKKDAKMDSHSSKVVSAVDRTMKKYADNILQVLEGMNVRLSHLESGTQVLGNSVASLKASVDSYHNEADARSKALNSHVMEMHRAVQIFRDKQGLLETNAELAKLQASKAEIVFEKAVKQPIVSSQIMTQEQLTVVSNLMPKRFPTELLVSSQQSNAISGQLQQISLSADVNALPQQLVPVQACTIQPTQQSLVLSQAESRPTLQPQEIIQSMPGAFQAQSQHAQSQHVVQPQLGVFQAQTQLLQAQQSLESQHGTFEAHQPRMENHQNPQLKQGALQVQPQHLQNQQNLQSQQWTFEAQLQHMQSLQSVQLQQGSFQAQRQQVHIRQSPQAQEEALQTQQHHVRTEQQTLPFQQGAFQSQAHHVQPQQGIQAPQGAFQTQLQHVQTQQSAQSSQGAIQSQQQQSQTQQNIQFQQGVIQASLQQQVQAQQSFQSHQGPQAQPFQAPVQGQMMQHPPHTQQTPNAHTPLQGVPPGQGSFQFTQLKESFAHGPISQAMVKHSPLHSAGPSYNVSNTGGSSQQHPLSSQPILPVQQNSNLYHRVPSPLQGSQPVYASQMARPVVSSAASSAGAVPVARDVYNQPLSGGPPINHFSWRGAGGWDS